MKITEEYTVPARKASKAKRVKLLCDIKGCDNTAAQGNYGTGGGKCSCGRDVCRAHKKYDDDDYGDYPNYWCIICYSLRFKKYRDEFLEIEREAERKEAEFDERVKRESLGMETPYASN